MKPRPTLVLALLAGFALTVGCGSDDGGSANGGSNGPTRFDEPTGPVEVTRGEDFEIGLAANPGTGYEWVVLDRGDSSVVEYQGSDYVADEGSEGVPGAGGTEVFRYRALAAGKTTVKLEYRPPGKQRSPDPPRRIEIVVR